MELKSNSDLHRYLLFLATQLRERGAADLAAIIDSASRQGSGMSTEFLGESRIALRHLLEKEQVVLTEAERKEVGDVLKQLDEVLDHRQPS